MKHARKRKTMHIKYRQESALAQLKAFTRRRIFRKISLTVTTMINSLKSFRSKPKRLQCISKSNSMDGNTRYQTKSHWPTSKVQ